MAADMKRPKAVIVESLCPITNEAVTRGGRAGRLAAVFVQPNFVCRGIDRMQNKLLNM